MVSPGAEQSIEVTERERMKLVYLKGIIDGIHRFQDDFSTYRSEILGRDGILLDRHINWIGVSNYLTPEVVLVMAKSPDNAKGGFSGVWEYPIYAITMSGHSIDLKRPWSLSVKVSRQRAKTDASSQLNSLKELILAFDERKKANCLMLLHQLEKIMVPKS